MSEYSSLRQDHKTANPDTLGSPWHWVCLIGTVWSHKLSKLHNFVDFDCL